MKPEGGDIMFFVKCQADGTTCFSKTIQEHDALVDIRNSIAELAHYRATLFKTPV